MIPYREQLDVLKDIRMREGQTRRINCPFCGGRNSFTISRSDGSQVWNCYRASCGVRGGKGTDLSIAGVRRRLSKTEDSTRDFPPMPDHVSRPDSHDKVIKYLEGVGSLEAYQGGLVHVRFEPRENRVLFYTQDRSGAVGRALDRRKPKWRVYGDTTGLFTVGTGRTAIVVEDAASACAMGVFTDCSGCALLGTSISVVQRQQLMEYERVIIALDKDASRKSLHLQRQLEGRVKTKVLYLEEDLKYLNKEQRRSIIYESPWPDNDRL